MSERTSREFPSRRRVWAGVLTAATMLAASGCTAGTHEYKLSAKDRRNEATDQKAIVKQAAQEKAQYAKADRLAMKPLQALMADYCRKVVKAAAAGDAHPDKSAVLPNGMYTDNVSESATYSRLYNNGRTEVDVAFSGRETDTPKPANCYEVDLFTFPSAAALQKAKAQSANQDSNGPRFADTASHISIQEHPTSSYYIPVSLVQAGVTGDIGVVVENRLVEPDWPKSFAFAADVSAEDREGKMGPAFNNQIASARQAIATFRADAQ